VVRQERLRQSGGADRGAGQLPETALRLAP
jgi:hypothetical protein